MKHTCYFRHALALDERRVKFLPEYAYGGTSLKPKCPAESGEKAKDISTSDNLPTTNNEDVVSHTKEVWFAGTHSDM
jgi:Uncharacterized alpha/beta hydrolase domain (DUF2235)